MNKYYILFQGDDVLITIEAKNASEARKIFNRQISFKKEKKVMKNEC